jgi:hypothetical protein
MPGISNDLSIDLRAFFASILFSQFQFHDPIKKKFSVWAAAGHPVARRSVAFGRLSNGG